MPNSKVPAHMKGTYIHAEDVKKIVAIAGGNFDLQNCQPCTRRVVVAVDASTTVISSAKFLSQPNLDQLDVDV